MSAFKNQTSNRWKAVSTRFDDLDEDEKKKLKNEQWAVGFKLSLSHSLTQTPRTYNPLLNSGGSPTFLVVRVQS